jgi:hypothetical protein
MEACSGQPALGALDELVEAGGVTRLNPKLRVQRGMLLLFEVAQAQALARQR